MVSARQPVRRLLSQSHGPLYVCRSCRTHRNQPRIDATQRRTLFDTESIRKKIWGTDNPPGLKDPYGGPSFLEKRKMRKEAEARALRQETQEQPSEDQLPSELAEFEDSSTPKDETRFREPIKMQEYRAAVTGRHLKGKGHRGEWTAMDPVPQDAYVPWSGPARRQSPSSRQNIKACLQQAIVECHTCQRANVNPTMVLSLSPKSPYSELIDRARIVPSGDGDAFEVIFASTEDQTTLADYVTHPAGREAEVLNDEAAYTSQDESAETISSLQSTEDSNGLETLRLGLNDPFTFLIFKRYALITGSRVPDVALSDWANSGSPLSFLLDRLSKPAKDSTLKVGVVLENRPHLQSQPNVQITGKKIGSKEKDTSLGLRKVIEQELRDRGLHRRVGGRRSVY